MKRNTKRRILWQRVRSTGLLEREPVMVKRVFSAYNRANGEHTDGKGPKSVNFAHYSHFALPTIEAKDRSKAEQSFTAHLNNTGRNHLDTEVPKWMKRLRVLAKLQPNKKAKSLWALLNQRDLWIAAYIKLAKNRGALTPGADAAKETIDGYNMKKLDHLRQNVVQYKYNVGISRRLNIPKPQGGLRPLTIPTFRDRVIQEVIRTILEAVFEPRFKQSSHGFRPGRSQHTCVKQIRRDFQGTRWYIEGDISQCFDSIPHETICKQIKTHVKDNRLIKLIRIGLKTKILNAGKLSTGLIGTPQGGVLSPLLSNIVLHPLDRLMGRLKRTIDRGKKRRSNPKYKSAYNKLQKAVKLGDKRKAAKYRRISRQHPTGLQIDPYFLRLSYTRYADDFLVGVIGPYALAERIKGVIARFLDKSLKLKLNQDKTLVTSAKKPVPWLGFRIQQGPTKTQSYRKRVNGKWRNLSSSIKGRIHVYANIRKVMCQLSARGFCDKSGNPKPNYTYFSDPQSYTVAQVSAIIRGLDNYYRVSNNRRQFTNRVRYIIRASIAKMFAAKFKLRSQKQVYQKAGRDLSGILKARPGKISKGATDAQAQVWAAEAGGKIKGPMPRIPFVKYKNIPLPDLECLPSNWGTSTYTPGEIGAQYQHLKWLENIYARSGRGRTALEASCAECGSVTDVEMHHIRCIRDLKGKTLVERMMIAANRKSIPLCQACHRKQHGWKSNSKIIM